MEQLNRDTTEVIEATHEQRIQKTIFRSAARLNKELVEGISLATFMLFTKLYLLKSPAFREEKEWRLITYHTGQMGEDRREFRAAGDRIIPFESIVMEDLNVSPINEIILGPKHITPVSVIQSLLDKHGYVGVSVSRSAASYR